MATFLDLILKEYNITTDLSVVKTGFVDDNPQLISDLYSFSQFQYSNDSTIHSSNVLPDKFTSDTTEYSFVYGYVKYDYSNITKLF
jgi:hypothetical protein